MKSYDIFISYRREDGADKARTLKSELELQGFHVFLDFDELKDGVFDQRIINAIESAPIFMMILSPHALDRCVNDDDWVRREIECALANHRHFVPVDPDRSFPGFLHGLPDSVKQGLGQHQFSEIMFGQLFKESVAKMVRERIRPALDVLGERNNGTPSGAGALIHIESDMDCRIFRFGKEIGLALKGEDTLIRLIRGKHKLEFVSLENDADRLTMLYPVPENDYEDILTIELLAVKAEREAVAAKAEQERLAKMVAEGKGRDGVYQVGDYYNRNGKQGVVFEVSDGGRHGKIVSLTQSRDELKWCSDEEYERKIETGASDEENGMNNQRIIQQINGWREKYPAFAYCADQGEGWYLPAIDELIFVLDDDVHNTVNRTLEAKGGIKLFNRDDWEPMPYWSSTEWKSNAAKKARLAFMVEDFEVHEYGDIIDGDKRGWNCYVRAVSAF